LVITARYNENMKTKPILYLFLPVLILFILSCSTGKKSTTSGKKPSKESMLNSMEKSNFEENYYNGIKAEYIENDVTKAIGFFEKCVSIDNKNTGALFELAKLNMQLRKYNVAQTLLESACKIDPTNKWYLKALVEDYTQQSNYEKAIVTLHKMADLDPNNIELYMKLSDLYIMDKQPAKAIKVLDAVEQITGIIPDISDRKRRIYLSINKFDEAVLEIKKLCNAYPENTDYIKSLIDMYNVYNKTGDILPLYKKILTIDSTDGKAQLMLAEYYKNTNQPALAKEYTIIMLRNPYFDVNNKISYLASTYARNKITPESKQQLIYFTDIILDEQPTNPQVLAFKGDIYYNINQMDSALYEYNSAMENDKSNYAIWKKVILIYFEKRNYDKAIEICNQAVEYFPTNPEIYFYEGIGLMQKKRDSIAAKVLETGKSYVTNNKQLLQQYYANLGEVYHNLSNNEKSDLNYTKALELDPNDGLVLNNYAYYLSLRKIRLEDAKKMSEKSLQLDPNNPANLDTYGWILYLMKDYTSAEKQITKALENKPTDPDILEHYGDILFKMGLIDKAVEAWQKAKSNGASNKNLDNKIRDRMLYE
jgi:tetratricopeptide (TPR) repeat protein